MAAVGDDKTVRLIDLSTGETTAALEKRIPIVNKPISVTHIRFSPAGDRMVYSGLLETGIWDPGSGETISLTGNDDWQIQGFDVSPDNTAVAGACSDNIVRIWRIETGELIHAIKGFPQGLSGVSYSPDGRTLAAHLLAPTVTLWNTRTWRQVGGFTLSSAARAARLSPDGRFLITGDHRDGARLWRAPLFREIEETSPMNPSP